MEKTNNFIRRTLLPASTVACLLLAAIAFSSSADGQNKRRPKPVRPTVSTTPTPVPSDPVVVSRADDFPVDDPGRLTMNDRSAVSDQETKNDSEAATIDDLRTRLRRLENLRKNDYDEKQRRLSLNLDILTKAEQRSDNLRKQLFEMIEKENSLLGRIDQIDNDLRPEAIERQLSSVGSLRPEELRAQRKRSLELEKQNLQTLLTEVQKNRTNLEQNLLRSDSLVERLRAKLDKDIDDALGGDSVDKP